MMKHTTALFVVLLGLAFAVGCLPTYVGDPATARIDPQLTGIWHTQSADDESIWTVEPLDDRTYIVRGFNIHPDEDARLVARQTFTADAWLTEIEGVRFVAMRLFSKNTVLNNNDGKNRYVVARFALEGDELTVRALSPETVKDASTPEALTTLIRSRLNDDSLYLQGQTYTRADPKKNASPAADALKMID